MINARYENLRALEFPGTERAIYLNAAGFAPLPARSRNAINEFNDRRHRGALRDTDLMSALSAARANAARLISATPDEIALTPNTNVGINIAANAVLERMPHKRTILISEREFPANVYPWLALQQHGFEVEIIPVDARGYPQEDVMLQRVAAGDVAALAVSFVQFSSGFRANLSALGNVCREHDVLFVVDAIQGLGALPLSVADTPVDILACGAQKWLCSPWGSGFTYIRKALIETFGPQFPGWLSFKASTDFTQLTHYEYEFVDDARRFETGSLAFQDQLGMAHSIELLLELRVEEIWQHIDALQTPIIDWAGERGVEIVSDLTPSRRSGILCLRPRDPAASHEALVAAGVVCGFRENAIRLAPHWYNTRSEMDQLIRVLNTAVK